MQVSSQVKPPTECPYLICIPFYIFYAFNQRASEKQPEAVLPWGCGQPQQKTKQCRRERAVRPLVPSHRAKETHSRRASHCWGRDRHAVLQHGPQERGLSSAFETEVSPSCFCHYGAPGKTPRPGKLWNIQISYW